MVLLVGSSAFLENAILYLRSFEDVSSAHPMRQGRRMGNRP